MRRPETIRAVVGTYERLTLHPESRTLSLLILAPIDQHSVAISAIGPTAEEVRAVGGDPGPACTVAVLPVEQPIHPDTGAIAVARACITYLRTRHARGDLRPIAPELEDELSQIANAAREDRLAAASRRRGAQ